MCPFKFLLHSALSVFAAVVAFESLDTGQVDVRWLKLCCVWDKQICLYHNTKYRGSKLRVGHRVFLLSMQGSYASWKVPEFLVEISRPGKS